MNEQNEKIKEEVRRQKETEEDKWRRILRKKTYIDKIYQYLLEYQTKYKQLEEAIKYVS
jgi:hypothetical protein